MKGCTHVVGDLILNRSCSALNAAQMKRGDGDPPGEGLRQVLLEILND